MNIFGGKSSDTGDSYGSQGGNKSLFQFDPSSLERAAKAAQVLRTDPNAQALLTIAINESKNKEKELVAKQKEYDLKLEITKKDMMKQQHLQTLEYMKEEASNHKARAEYEDYLARKRFDDQLAIQKKTQEEFLKMQEESTARQEKKRRETLDYVNRHKKKGITYNMATDYKEKALYRSNTYHLKKELMKEDFMHKKEYMESVFSNVRGLFSEGFHSLKEDPIGAAKISLVLVAFAAVLGFCRIGTNVASRYFERAFKHPKLLRESSRTKSPKSTFDPTQFKAEGLIFNAETEKVLAEVVQSTIFSRSRSGYFGKYLLYGPPGTGKTMFARKLALNSGLSYAIMSGGDIIPFREQASNELNHMLDWASKDDGMLLFMDEADAFLRKRGQADMGESMRSALNTFLYRTGESNSKLMLVLATNRPEELDPAVTNRMDYMICFNLPDEEARKAMIELYLKQNVTSKNIVFEQIELDKIIDQLVEKTEGLSGREISKLSHLWNVIALSTNKGILTSEMMIDAANRIKEQKARKMSWNSCDIKF